MKRHQRQFCISRFEPLERRIFLSTLYVDAAGDDANPGTIDQPFKTIDRVNHATLSAGDTVAFAGGQTFDGNLVLAQSGTADNPITITSYGTGRATLFAGQGDGIFAENVGGIHITNIDLAGASFDHPMLDVTSLSADAAAGATTITLASLKDLKANQIILLDGPNPEQVYIGALPASGTTVALRAGTHLAFAHAASTPVRSFAEKVRDGIEFVNTSDHVIGHVQIDHVNIRGFAGVFPSAGISIIGQSQANGFSDVSITDSVLEKNGPAGIFIAGTAKPDDFANHNITISRVHADHNCFNCEEAYLTSTVTETVHYPNLAIEEGIAVFDSQDVTIDRVTAGGNGKYSGTVGIWFSRVDRGVIQHAEAYGTVSGNGTDGDGIDLDGSTTNSVIQYCYTHDNDGGGLALYSFGNSTPLAIRQSLAKPAAPGDRSIEVASTNGIMPGAVILVGPFDLAPDRVRVDAKYVPGSTTVPLAIPIAHRHESGALVGIPGTLTAAAAKGDTQINTDFVDGLQPGQYLVLGRKDVDLEQIPIADNYLPGSKTIPLKHPLALDHPLRDMARFSIVPANHDNAIRFNISENDGRKIPLGGIVIWSDGLNNAGVVRDSFIHNNTVFMSPMAIKSTEPSTPIRVFGQVPTNIRIVDNLLISSAPGGAIVDIANPAGPKNVEFLGNHYWAIKGPAGAQFNGKMFDQLQAWQAATGQEILDGKSLAVDGDPHLAKPGSAGTVGSWDRLANISAYTPTAPLPSTFILKEIGDLDFLGHPIPPGTSFPGAVEFTAK
jgi:hypothetical protein